MEGVRILDLSRAWAGSYGTMILGDLGAEILKVEPPEGDDTRQHGRFAYHGMSSVFMCANRNKKSLVLDLKTHQGKEVFYDLVKVSDATYDNFRPGVMDRLGLGYEQLKKLNPTIICASVTGWGSTGPYAGRPAWDLMLQAFTGHMSVTGEPGGPPQRSGIGVADLSAAVYGAVGVLAALYGREQTGTGQKVDTSILGATLSFMGSFIADYCVSGIVPTPIGSHHTMGAPYGVFRTKDRPIVISAIWDTFFVRLCRLLGLENLSTDVRFQTNSARARNLTQLLAILEPVFLTKGSEEWLRLLEQEDIGCAPVNTVDKAVDHPQTKALNMVVAVDHVAGGQVRLPGNPVKFSQTPTETFTSPPLMGQHTREVLGRLLNYSEAKIGELLASGAIMAT
ncbi:MAG: CoA transferase [Chloroflexi bacterium]|nr:CoA transferase [Chloroflexota bacterium]